MDENKMKNLEAMKEFFERDMKIKETLMSLAPTEADDYDELSRMEYVDKLEKGLDSLEYDTLASIKKFGFGEELNNTIREYFANKKKSMAVGKYGKKMMRNFRKNQMKFMILRKFLSHEIKII